MRIPRPDIVTPSFPGRTITLVRGRKRWQICVDDSKSEGDWLLRWPTFGEWDRLMRERAAVWL